MSFSLSSLGSRSANLQTIDSVALSGQNVLAGSNNDIHVSTIDFSTSPPSLSRFDTQLNGGCVTAIQGGSGAGGAVLGTSVKLFGATNNVGKT